MQIYVGFNPVTAKFHNFKWVKIIQIWQNGGQLFQILLVDVTFYL